jgi:hypothetical protein
MNDVLKLVRSMACLLIEVTAALLFMLMLASVVFHDPMNLLATVQQSFVVLNGYGFVGLLSLILVFSIYFWLKGPE